MLSQFKSLPFYHKLAAVLVSLVATGYLVIQGKELLSPLIFSCLFSILLLPIASFLERKFRFRRGLASAVAVLMMLAVVATIVYIVAVQMSNLTEDWPQFKMQLNSSLSTLQHWIAAKFHINANKQLTYVKSATSDVIASGTAVVGVTIVSLSSFLLFLVFTFIYTLFFLTFRRIIMQFLIAVFLEENSIIPYIGIFTATVISVVITFATAAATTKVLFVLITLISTHLVDSNILLPAIVGSKVKINPLITVLGVVLGEMIWGISGMFLSIPVIAVLKIIFDRVESLRPWGVLLGEEDKTHRIPKNQHEIQVVSTEIEEPVPK
jgi:putative permease